MTALEIRSLRGGVEGRELLQGVDLEVGSGQVHVLMGPNGSGKSTLAHVLTAKPGYSQTGGQILLGGEDLSAFSTWERVRRGLFLVPQYPVEVPGVGLEDMLVVAGVERRGATQAMVDEAARIGLDPSILERPVNVDLSGGEKKRSEILQLALLRPHIAILDEVDSGLDVDALRAVAGRVSQAIKEWGLGILAITHYNRLLEHLPADRVHIFSGGQIVRSGGPELAEEIERTGYAPYGGTEPATPR